MKAWLGLGVGVGREWPLPGREALGVTLLFVLFFFSAATKMEELTQKYKSFSGSLRKARS